MRIRLVLAMTAAALSVMTGAALARPVRTAGPANLPRAIWADPPVDPAHPAAGLGVQFTSHGETINAQLYQPPGGGVHPTVVLVHGLPGNEQNLDLAQAMRRAGFTVITFHYRGSWGTGGVFALNNAAEDTEALLAELHRPERARAWGVDPRRLILVGHSYGGWAAAKALADTPDLLGAALIAPWDPSYDARAWKPLSPEALNKVSQTAWDDCIGRLTGATTTSLTEMVMRQGPGDDLTALAPRLAGRRLLIFTAVHDDPDDQAAGLIAALKASPAPRVRTRLMDTDHGFNDHRIALEAAVLRWLASLPR